MDDEFSEESPPEPKEKPSQVPSWIILGFILGALFVLALPRHSAPPAEAKTEATIPVVAVPAKAGPIRLTTIEAVFEDWGKYAVWSNGTTEVALWNSETKSFSECYEVAKVGDSNFFRSIPALTRPVLTHGVVIESPLQFTETERQRNEWLRQVDEDNFRALANAAKTTMPLSTPPEAPLPQVAPSPKPAPEEH